MLLNLQHFSTIPLTGAQKLSLRCLTLDPAERPTLEEILNDPFLLDAPRPPLPRELIENGGVQRENIL